MTIVRKCESWMHCSIEHGFAGPFSQQNFHVTSKSIDYLQPNIKLVMHNLNAYLFHGFDPSPLKCNILKKWKQLRQKFHIMYYRGAFHQAFCQWFSLTNFISYWNPCIWLAESKFVSENTDKMLDEMPPPPRCNTIKWYRSYEKKNWMKEKLTDSAFQCV